MRSRAAFFVALALSAMPLSLDARTATTAERKACEAPIRADLAKLQALMRSGYTRSQGERLKAKRRDLQERLAACRYVP